MWREHVTGAGNPDTGRRISQPIATRIPASSPLQVAAGTDTGLPQPQGKAAKGSEGHSGMKTLLGTPPLPKLNASTTGFSVKCFAYNFSFLPAFSIPPTRRNKQLFVFVSRPRYLYSTSFFFSHFCLDQQGKFCAGK